jgi:hypothetical protein
MLELGRPDDFRGDPYGWLTNQMSHVLVGITGAWLLMKLGCPPWCAVAAAALVSATVEAVHLHRGGRLGDTLADVAFVVSGAVWHLEPGVPLFLLIALGFVLGVRSRLAERQTDAQTGDR